MKHPFSLVRLILLLVVGLILLGATSPTLARTPHNDDWAGPPPVARQDEFGVRHESALGTPACPQSEIDDGEPRCLVGPWLATRSQNFVNIKKLAYLRGPWLTPQGVQMSGSFVAERDETAVAIAFSAEAHVVDDVARSNRRLFVRALVDGQVVDPADVVFAVGGSPGARTFTFTTTVDKGIHSVEIQWRVDSEATAYMRDATLLIRSGRSLRSGHGTLTVYTPPSGGNLEIDQQVWQDIPGMSGLAYVPFNGILTAHMSAETAVIGPHRLFLRALVDGQPALPGDVVFAQGNKPQSRGMTFGTEPLTTGWHNVRFQWLVDAGGTGIMGDRSLVLAAYPSSTQAPSHPLIFVPGNPPAETDNDQFTSMPGMVATIVVPERGNGEAAVVVSGEAWASGGGEARLALAVDGVRDDDTIVTLTRDSLPQTHSFTFAAKGLAPGFHQLEIEWRVAGGGTIGMADRTMAVMSETGYIPDLAEAPRFGGGHIGSDSDFINGIEPLIGERSVLAILWDPDRCTGDEGDITSGEPCIDQDDLPVQTVEEALFGGAGQHNVRDYLLEQSNGLFSIANAGVLGWVDAVHPSEHYWNHPGDSCATTPDNYTSGHVEKRAEAVMAIDDQIDFSQYDRNNDGIVEQTELAILIVIPQPVGNGSSVGLLLNSQCPANTRLQADGVTLPQYVVDWYTSLDNEYEGYQYTTAAHELMHLLGGLDDMYVDEDHSTYVRRLSLMASNAWTTTHLDPAHKLALGWVTPRVMDADQTAEIEDVKTSGEVWVMPRYNNPWAEEYFIVENRRQNNAQNGHYDHSIADKGIAVWHIVSDPVENALAPIGSNPSWNGLTTMARRGIRLLRPWETLNQSGTAVFENKDNTLWDWTEYDLLSDDCPVVFFPNYFYPNTLTWADCTASGYELHWLSPQAAVMEIGVAYNE